jgi:hypothetical protein
MNNKQKRLADKLAIHNPVEGRILVCPDKLRTYKYKGFNSTPVDPDVKEEDITSETEMRMEEAEMTANHKFQTAVVLQKPSDETRFDIGDTVVFYLGALEEFDLVKGVSILRKYDVVTYIKV